ncbi:acyl-CoA thioesterase [Puteibacter caeruleilacunae]|nr:acyl-CoA thioesterase [Puteibacter caeruleilacunae]
MEYFYEIEMEVRDYECDLQGIVNNSVYQNYLEHARHQFLDKYGLNFAQLHNDGIDGVVTRIEIDYKDSLRPGDRFVVRLNMTKKGNVRFVFNQAIFRKSDDKLMIQAKVFGVLTQNRRPIAPTVFDETLKAHGLVMQQEK